MRRALGEAVLALLVGTVVAIGGAYGAWWLVPASWSGVALSALIGVLAATGIIFSWAFTLMRWER